MFDIQPPAPPLVRLDVKKNLELKELIEAENDLEEGLNSDEEREINLQTIAILKGNFIASYI